VLYFTWPYSFAYVTALCTNGATYKHAVYVLTVLYFNGLAISNAMTLEIIRGTHRECFIYVHTSADNEMYYAKADPVPQFLFISLLVSNILT
jgi:hypothetical protein